MNANELADWLETGEVEEYDINEAATMLRQQQVEIEALKTGDIQWNHAFDLAKIEIADLKAEIEALKEALRMKVILNEHAQQAMKGYKELLK